MVARLYAVMLQGDKTSAFGALTTVSMLVAPFEFAVHISIV